jgi:hypothetical protein
VRSPAEQAAYEKSLHPGWSEGWAGGLNLGFAVSRGNSETRTWTSLSTPHARDSTTS